MRKYYEYANVTTFETKIQEAESRLNMPRLHCLNDQEVSGIAQDENLGTCISHPTASTVIFLADPNETYNAHTSTPIAMWANDFFDGLASYTKEEAIAAGYLLEDQTLII